MVSVRRRSRSRAGFTLMEMVTVVAIMAVTAAIAMPGVTQAVREKSAYNAMTDALRLFTRARYESMGYGRAYLVRYNKNLQSLTLYRGRSNRCKANAWNVTLIPAGTCASGTGYCVGSMSVLGTTTKMSALDGAATPAEYGDLDLCVEPSGRGRYRTSGITDDLTLFTGTNGIGGGIFFKFQAQAGGSDTGVDHRLVVPLAGPPRIWR